MSQPHYKYAQLRQPFPHKKYRPASYGLYADRPRKWELSELSELAEIEGKPFNPEFNCDKRKGGEYSLVQLKKYAKAAGITTSGKSIWELLYALRFHVIPMKYQFYMEFNGTPFIYDIRTLYKHVMSLDEGDDEKLCLQYDLSPYREEILDRAEELGLSGEENVFEDYVILLP